MGDSAAVTTYPCASCSRPIERTGKPGRPARYCATCKGASRATASPEPEPFPHEATGSGEPAGVEHPGDAMRRQADVLLDQAADALAEAARLGAQARDLHVQAAKLKRRADEMDDPTKKVAVTVTAYDRVRDDGLVAAAAVAVEDLPSGFSPRDLAASLGIADPARALRILLALAHLGKVGRQGDGWAMLDPDEAPVRDFVAEHREGTFADIMDALGMPEDIVAEQVAHLVAKGVIESAGGHWAYLDTPPERKSQRERRTPPEKMPPAGTEAPKRGEPVRIVDHGKRANAGARHREKLRDQRHEALQEAKRQRSERDKAKARKS